MIPECENKTCVDIALDSFNIRTFTINLMESEELEAKRIRIDTSSSKVIVTNNDSGITFETSIYIIIYLNLSVSLLTLCAHVQGTWFVTLDFKSVVHCRLECMYMRVAYM